MENKIVEVTTEDKIAKLKATLEGMELLGATIPQAVKDAVIQEIAVLEAKALEEIEIAKANTVSFYTKYRDQINIIGAMIVIQVIAKLVG